MPTPYSPSDVARVGHRFQVQLAHASGETLVASRVQRFEPAIQTNMDVYHELGTVDPTGYASDAPAFRITIEENVHAADLDLLLAGKAVASDTSWNLGDYINDGDVTAYLVERDNAGTIVGELELDNCVLQDVTWRWAMGQPIVATYTLQGRLGKRWLAAGAPHKAGWGVQDTTAPGDIKIKDARVFLGGNAAGNRVYRIQGFTLRVAYRTTVVREAGSRPLVGTIVEPPDTSLDVDFAVADSQPDDYFFTYVSASGGYYDYVNPLLLTNSAIRVYDPTANEAQTVLRAWKLENLIPGNATPVLAQTRGLATKRYTLLVPKVTTANTGGVVLYKGDIA